MWASIYNTLRVSRDVREEQKRWYFTEFLWENFSVIKNLVLFWSLDFSSRRFVIGWNFLLLTYSLVLFPVKYIFVWELSNKQSSCFCALNVSSSFLFSVYQWKWMTEISRGFSQSIAALKLKTWWRNKSQKFKVYYLLLLEHSISKPFLIINAPFPRPVQLDSTFLNDCTKILRKIHSWLILLCCFANCKG